MSLIQSHTAKTTQKEIIHNTTTDKVFVITNLRVSNEQSADYKFWTYLRDPEGNILQLTYDDLESGDYVIDSTIIELTPGYALLDMTDVETETVKVTVTVFKKKLEPTGNYDTVVFPNGVRQVFDEVGSLKTGIPGPMGPGASVTSAQLSATNNNLSNEASNRLSADAALSTRIDLISGAGASVTSNDLSVSNAHVNTVSNNLSNEISNRVSSHNALSNAISAVSNALSAEASARVAKDDILSNNISVLSNVISAVANALSNETSNRVSAEAALSTRIDNASASVTSNELSIVSAHVDAVSNDLSNAISNRISADAVLSEKISVVSNALSVETAARIAKDDTLSNSISVLSQGISVVSNALSNEVSNRISADNALSNLISVVSNALSVEIAARVAKDDILSNGISVVSNALSNAISNRVSADDALSNQISNLLSIHNVLSNRVSANSGTGGAGSVTSNELSAVSAQAQSAINVVSNAISNEISNRASADVSLAGRIDGISHNISVLSQQVSVLSNALSVAISNRVSADNALSDSISNLLSLHNVLSNRVSANSGTGGAGSVTSNELSAVSAQAQSAIDVISNAVSVVSNALSNEISNRISADNLISQQVSVLSQAVSVLSVAVAAVANVQQKTRANAVSVFSANTLADIQDLFISVSANGIYVFDGAAMFECGVSGGYAFGLSVPPLAAGGSFIRMNAQSGAPSQGNTGAGIPEGFLTFSAVAALNTAVVSVSVATVNTLRLMSFDGMLYVSTTGTVRIMAKTSVAAQSMSVRGGYIRAYKIGTF